MFTTMFCARFAFGDAKFPYDQGDPVSTQGSMRRFIFGHKTTQFIRMYVRGYIGLWIYFIFLTIRAEEGEGAF